MQVSCLLTRYRLESRYLTAVNTFTFVVYHVLPGTSRHYLCGGILSTSRCPIPTIFCLKMPFYSCFWISRVNMPSFVVKHCMLTFCAKKINIFVGGLQHFVNCFSLNIWVTSSILITILDKLYNYTICAVDNL